MTSCRVKIPYESSMNALFHYDAKEIDYSTQYNHLYNIRTQTLKSLIMINVNNIWLDHDPQLQVIRRIIDAETSTFANIHQDCVIIGIVYKEMLLRASVIKEIKDGYNLSGPVKSIENYVSKRDQVYLEDDSGRIMLSGTEEILSILPTLVTGVMLAVRGRFDSENGLFIVSDYLFAGPQSIAKDSLMDIPIPPIAFPSDTMQPKRNSNNQNNDNHNDDDDNDSYVLFVSGLEFGDKPATLLTPSLHSDSSESSSQTMATENNENDDYLFSCQLLADFIGGRIGSSKDIALAKKISRVIIAGNSIGPADPYTTRDKYSMNNPNQKQLESIKSIRQFDMFLTQILSTCPVDVLPGPYDPTSHCLPQQPLRSFLFPHSSRFNTLHLTTNPHYCTLGEEKNILLGHSGLAIQDIALQSTANICSNAGTKNKTKAGDDDGHNEDAEINEEQEENYPIDILRRTFQWSHIIPTCPDTLPGYPFKNYDPFIIDTTKPDTIPRIFYAGNQVDYDSDIMTYQLSDGVNRNVLLLTIPSYRLTRQVVIVNLRTLASSTISFQDMFSINQSNQSNDNNSGSLSNNPGNMTEKHHSMKLKKKKAEDDSFVIDYSDSMELDI